MWAHRTLDSFSGRGMRGGSARCGDATASLLPDTGLRFGVLAATTDTPAHEPAAGEHAPLEVVSMSVAGCLHRSWSYSENLHEATTIETLAAAFTRTLQALLEALHHSVEAHLGLYPRLEAHLGLYPRLEAHLGLYATAEAHLESAAPSDAPKLERLGVF